MDGQESKGQGQHRIVRYIAVTIIGLILFLIILQPFFNTSDAREEISYSQFLELVHRGQAAKVRIKGDLIKGTTVDGSIRFKTVAPNDPELILLLKEKGVQIVVEQVGSPYGLLLVLDLLLPTMLFLSFWMWLGQKMRGTS